MGEKDDRQPVSKEFTKITAAVGIKRKGATFYALRHTARTIMDESGDFPAADRVMGHARDDMASVYREQLADSRLRAVAEHVREWLFGEPPDAERAEPERPEGNGLKLFAG